MHMLDISNDQRSSTVGGHLSRYSFTTYLSPTVGGHLSQRTTAHHNRHGLAQRTIGGGRHNGEDGRGRRHGGMGGGGGCSGGEGEGGGGD